MIKTCEGLSVIHAANGDIEIAGEIVAVVGICPHCDATHLRLNANGVGIMLDLTPQEAEAIGKALINPEPIK